MSEQLDKVQRELLPIPGRPPVGRIHKRLITTDERYRVAMTRQ